MAFGILWIALPCLAFLWLRGEDQGRATVIWLLVVVWATVGYWPPEPMAGLGLLAAQTTVLLTLGLMLATFVSPMASGIVAVGLFGATWIAGIIGMIGELLDNDGVARIGTVSRMLLPTDGLWRGAMHAFQDPTVLAVYGVNEGPHPFLGDAGLE